MLINTNLFLNFHQLTHTDLLETATSLRLPGYHHSLIFLTPLLSSMHPADSSSLPYLVIPKAWNLYYFRWHINNNKINNVMRKLLVCQALRTSKYKVILVLLFVSFSFLFKLRKEDLAGNSI